MPTIKVPPVLRPQTDGEAEVSVEGGTVGDALRALAERYPSTRDQLFSPDGELNRYVNVYLNDEDVRVLDGLETGTTNSDIVVILPAMAGGCPRRRRPPLEVRARRRAPARAHYRRALSLNPRDVELLKLSGRAAQE